MRKSHLFCLALVTLLLAGWNVGQAQDSLGMHCLSGLGYWQSTESIQMVGDLVYVVGGSSGLHIMNLEDPAHPEEVGRFTWYQYSESGGGVYVVGNLAYLGIETGGFVLDVSDPTHPVVVGQWTTIGASVISFVHGNFAIAHSDEGIPYVLDITNPTNVHYIGGFPGNGIVSEAMGMAGEYLCTSGSGLRVWDMSNPAAPQLVASADTIFGAYYGAISGDYGFLASVDYGLRIIDLSNPLLPVEVAACDSGGLTWDVTVSGSHAVTLKCSSSWDNYWLNIWNIANPAQPVFEGTIGVETLGSSRVSSSGNLVCTTMSGSDYVVMVVDISDPAAPVEVSSFGPRGILARTAIRGTTAYLADYVTGFRTVDLSVPYHISEFAHMNTIGIEGMDVAVRDNFAYVTAHGWGHGCGVVVFDVSNPAEPESLGYVYTEHGGDQIVIGGDYAYVTGYSDLYTFSLANPAIPLCVDSQLLNNRDEYRGLTVLNGYLYYGCESSFYVYNLSNPAMPQLVGSCNLGGGLVFDLAASGDYVFVADGFNDTRIVDVRNPTNPSEINWIGGYAVFAVAAAGNMVVMDDLTRISIYDVTDPLDPRLVGYYSTYEYITDMEIQGQYLFTTSGYEFRVYQCDALTNIIAPSEPFPTEFSLLPPYPNPFNNILTIPFTIPIQKEVLINIYNILGQKVHELAFPHLSPGPHQILWDATMCASGVYIIQSVSSGRECRQKVVLLK